MLHVGAQSRERPIPMDFRMYLRPPTRLQSTPILVRNQGFYLPVGIGLGTPVWTRISYSLHKQVERHARPLLGELLPVVQAVLAPVAEGAQKV